MLCSTIKKFHAKHLKTRAESVDLGDFIGPDWDGWRLGHDGIVRCPQFPHGLHPRMIYALQLEYMNSLVFEVQLRRAQARIAELEKLLADCEF